MQCSHISLVLCDSSNPTSLLALFILIESHQWFLSIKIPPTKRMNDVILDSYLIKPDLPRTMIFFSKPHAPC